VGIQGMENVNSRCACVVSFITIFRHFAGVQNSRLGFAYKYAFPVPWGAYVGYPVLEVTK
jgi:hypothetical protein